MKTTDAHPVKQQGVKQHGVEQQIATTSPSEMTTSALVSEELQSMLRAAGLQRTSTGTVAVLDSKSGTEVHDLKNTQQIYGATESQLKAPSPPSVDVTEGHLIGAQVFARNIDTAVNDYLLTRTSNGTQALTQEELGSTPSSGDTYYVRNLSRLSADDLLAAFLKLNVVDPNNSTETHNKLHAIATNMRQLAIAEAKKKIENAIEARKEAEAYAEQAEYLSLAVQVASIGASAFTMGSSFVAAQAATQVAKEAASQATQQVIQQATQEASRQVARMTAEQMSQTAVQQLVSQGMSQNAASAMVQQMSQNQIQSLVTQNLTNQLATQMSSNLSNSAMQKIMQDTMSKLPAEQLKTQMGNQWQERIMTQVGDQVATQVKDQLAQQTNQMLQNNFQGQIQTQLQESMSRGVNDAVSRAGAQAAESASSQGLSNASPDAIMNESYTQGFNTNANGSLFDQAMMNTQNMAGKANPALRQVGMATNALGSMIDGVAEFKMAMNEADIAEMRNDASRHEFLADLHQDQIEDQGLIMKEIMESKNRVVDATLSMMNASFVSKQKLSAANMVR